MYAVFIFLSLLDWPVENEPGGLGMHYGKNDEAVEAKVTTRKAKKTPVAVPEEILQVAVANVVVEVKLETVMITSPVAATVKRQLELIMNAVDKAVKAGKTSCSIHRVGKKYVFSKPTDIHAETWKVLKHAGIELVENDEPWHIVVSW